MHSAFMVRGLIRIRTKDGLQDKDWRICVAATDMEAAAKCARAYAESVQVEVLSIDDVVTIRHEENPVRLALIDITPAHRWALEEIQQMTVEMRTVYSYLQKTVSEDPDCEDQAYIKEILEKYVDGSQEESSTEDSDGQEQASEEN